MHRRKNDGGVVNYAITCHSMLRRDAPQYMYSTLLVHLDLVVTQVNTYSLSVYSKHWPWSGENSSSWPKFKFKTRSRSLKRREPNTVILLERATQLLSNRVGSLHVSDDDAPLSSPTQLSLAFLVLISLRVDYPQHNLLKYTFCHMSFSWTSKCVPCSCRPQHLLHPCHQ